ncbi:hypothetical protein [Thiohalorhabdus methylotrophus]|uniref:Uncharacterized protein n=1 Tax=Thiohalorhabdus methylotrophus TaxID=3242694 RepID=A0ABV4TS66_9GAMM
MEDANREEVLCMSPTRVRIRAALFHVGNLICMLAGIGAGVAYFVDFGLVSTVLSVALILPTVLWFGASMALYSFFAEDPHSLVSRHTRRAGYHFYGASGAGLMVIAFLQKVSIAYLLPIPALVIGTVIFLGIRDLWEIWRADLGREAGALETEAA